MSGTPWLPAPSYECTQAHHPIIGENGVSPHLHLSENQTFGMTMVVRVSYSGDVRHHPLA